MQLLNTFFDASSVFFTVPHLKYEMSYIEFFGTIFSIASVWLVARNRTLNWPVGIIGTVLFMALYYQIQLYADFFEQIYFVITGFWGWWLWSKNPPREETGGIAWSSKSGLLMGLALTVLLSVLAGFATSRLHTWSPRWFPEEASLPYLDATTTIMSFTATILLVYRRVEAWIYWVLLDIVGIWLYHHKGLLFVSLLYIVFLILASNGLFQWLRKSKQIDQTNVK